MILKVLFLLFLLRNCVGDEDEVIQYDDDDFEDKMNAHDTAMVMFYAPWCGHCKKLKPEYAEAAESLTKSDPSVALVKVDCTESGKATCEKYGVAGYPSLKVFRRGEYVEDYSGPRDKDGIIKYMRAQVKPKPKLKQLISDEEVEDFLRGGGGDEAKTRVVGYLYGETDFKQNFFKVAEEMSEMFDFGYRLGEGTNQETILLHRAPMLRNKFEEDRAIYQASCGCAEKIKKFLIKNQHGLVGFRTPENREDFDTPLVVAYYRVDYAMDPKGTQYWKNRVLKVAQQFKNLVTFAISNKNDFSDEMNEHGLENFEGKKPIVLARDDGNKKYLMEDTFSCENLTKFVQDFLDSKLEPTIKSEPVPLDNEGPVKVAVAKNFDNVVKSNDKDTLLEFYAPWCGHCKQLAPVYEELAEKMKDERVDIVKMDATANEIPSGFNVDSYPSIFWLPKEKKNEPIVYDGDRQLEDFVKFIAEHATEELEGYDRQGNVKLQKTEL